MKYAVDWCNLNILLQQAQYQYLIRHFISFIWVSLEHADKKNYEWMADIC